MKQSEQISAPVGIGAATIYECSNDAPRVRIPRLTITLPAHTYVSNQGHSDAFQVNHPAESVMLQDEAVRELYNFLHGYFAP